MIDLSGIARHLRLPVEQIRVAADLLEQGYQPGFIERYRADETGCLPRATLWAVKFEIDRLQRLQAARERASKQLPKDAELDTEAEKFLARAHSEVEIEAALRAFRSRRTLSQGPDAAGHASQLLEKLIEYQGPPLEDLPAWVGEQLAIDRPAAEAALQQASRLVGTLIHSDTGLNQSLRSTIQRKSQISVELLDAHSHDSESPDSDRDDQDASGEVPSSGDEAANADAGDQQSSPPQVDSTADNTDQQPSETQSSETQSSQAGTSETQSSEIQLSETQPSETQPSEAGTSATEAAPVAASASSDQQSDNSATKPSPAAAESSQLTAVAEADPNHAPQETEPTEQTIAPEEAKLTTAPADASSQPVPTEEASVATAPANATQADNPVETPQPTESQPAAAEGKPNKSKRENAKSDKKEAKEKKSKATKKSLAKMTPRQRRRRWLIAMLQPMKTLKKPLPKLTAYQQLMLGRGRRSQLVAVNLAYDKSQLVAQARDAFVNQKHPLAAWFSAAAEEALESSLRSKLEQDAIADLEEMAAEKLLETAVDQLRQSLMQRPVRGHRTLVIDAVGPKAAAVAVVAADGSVLATDEIPCSASPGIVNQNVVRLGELVHQHRVTLVAMTNGPARRFLVLSLRELMKQSASSGLRWTMADRGGAEAYAVSRSALKELSAHSRRHRAAVWVAWCLQDPLGELLKVDVNRLRLGSFQRELPQEPLKKLVRETISDCICYQGIDARSASVEQLLCVAGVNPPQASQIVALSTNNQLTSRAAMLAQVQDWPELDARQAIGLLRVFESEQPLDATTIHPDDYRLAERLIENTELAAPASAPEGWTPPSIKAESAHANAVATAVTDTAASPDSSPPSSESEQTPADGIDEPTQSEAAASEETSTEKTLEAKSADDTATESPTDAAATTDEAPADSTAAGTDPAASPAEEVAAGGEHATAQPTSETPTAGSEPAETTADSEAPSKTEDTPAVPVTQAAVDPNEPKPEYPEDIDSTSTTGPVVDVEKLARGWQVGREKLRWVAHCLQEPFRDPRLSRPPVPLLKEMPTLSSLEPGMCVWAVVVGVADFGAFVELAPDCSGLIHISRLSPNFVEDPHQCVQVGDLIMAWVVSVDEKKNRVALTALSPAERAAAESQAADRKSAHGEQRRRDNRGGGREGQAAGKGQQGQSQSGHGHSRDGGRRGGGGGRPRGGNQQGRGRGRPEFSKTVVVTSKKPKAVITEKMKEGEEPLRSFSDLMQFYESKRTEPTPPPPSPPEPPKTEE